MSVEEFLPAGTAAGSNGVRITPDKILPVTGPVPAPRREEEDGEVSEEDGEVVLIGSDVEYKDGGVVDTDAESDADSDVDSDTSSSDESVTDLKAKVAKVLLKTAPAPAAIDEKPTTGGPSQAFRRHGVIPLWHDDYLGCATVPPTFRMCEPALNSDGPCRTTVWASRT